MKYAIRRVISCVLSVMIILSCMGVVSAASNITLPDLISNNMLIQSDMPIKLWGYGGTPGDSVVVIVENEEGKEVNSGSAEIGNSGFTMELPAMEAGGPYTLRFSDGNGAKIANVTNVLVGDLYLQGGQSNMAFKINKIPADVPERVTPKNTNGQIRVFINSTSKSDNENDIKGQWVVADENLSEYSAVGYGALEKIYDGLKTPVGGICSAIGGVGLGKFSSRNEDLYRSYVAPALQFNMKGVMWYQGETDAVYSTTPDEFVDKYNTLISLLREENGNKNLPFLLVQHQPSPWKEIKSDGINYRITDFSDLRIGIGNACDELENVYMAVALDLSVAKYMNKGQEPIHPYIKKPLADRLGLLALDVICDENVQGKSPSYLSYVIDGNKIKVTVKDEYDGLKTADGNAPTGFMIAGADGVYYEANATVSGNEIIISSDKVAKPVSASYGYEKHRYPYTDIENEDDLKVAPSTPELPANVVNSANLPLASFDTTQSKGAQGGVNAPKDDITDYEIPDVAPIETSGDRTILYVATNGSDTNDGSINAPFASVTKARDTLRSMKLKGTIGKDGAVVYVRGGKYPILKSIELNKEDSGTKDAPITYRAYPGEKVEFIGGMDIKFEQFKPVSDSNIISRVIDQTAKTKLVSVNLKELGLKDIPEPDLIGQYSYTYGMAELYDHPQPDYAAAELMVNGEVQTLARYPNDGFMEISDVIHEGAIPRNWADDKKESPDYVEPKDRFNDPFTIVVNDDRVKNWAGIKDMIIYGKFWVTWADQSVYVANVDPKNKSITSTHPSCYGVAIGQPVYVFNLLEEIDMPGEYYIDKESGELYYYPVKGTIEEVKLTTLTEPMFAFGDCEYVNIKDFKLGFTRAGVISLNGSKNCDIEGIEVEYTGRMAIKGVNSYDCRIANSYFHDVNGGVIFECGDRNTLTPGNCIIENNEFFQCDRIQKAYNRACEVKGVGNIIRFNKMHGAEQTITGYSGNNHHFCYNEIYDAATVADDMGAFYNGRNITARGNKMYFNYYHDLGSSKMTGNHGVQAIYFDDFQSWSHVAGNIFENIIGRAFACGGSHNAFVNNIFINAGSVGHFGRSYDYGKGNVAWYAGLWASLEDVPYLSDVWVEQYPEIVNVVDDKGQLDVGKNIRLSDNILINTSGPVLRGDMGEQLIEERNIVYENDPGFVDMENRNYLLKPDAQIFKDNPNFQPIPFTRIGMYTDRAKLRVKDSGVFMIDSPYAIVGGETTENAGMVVENGVPYASIRTLASIVGAEVAFDEETNMIKISTDAKIIAFENGKKDKIEVNQKEIVLKNPIIKTNGTNYLSLYDFAAIFDMSVLSFDNLVVLAEMQNLLDADADAELIRYYKDELSIY